MQGSQYRGVYGVLCEYRDLPQRLQELMVTMDLVQQGGEDGWPAWTYDSEEEWGEERLEPLLIELRAK